MARDIVSVGTFGEGIVDLHRSLQAQGLKIPSSELQRQFFGPGTRAAVMQLQAAHGLSQSGEVDAQTAMKIGLTSSSVVARNLPPQESGDAAVSASPALAILATGAAASGVSGRPGASAPPHSGGGSRTTKPIAAPLRENDRGEAVINLQEGLLVLLEKGIIKAIEQEQRSFEEGLKQEHERQIYGGVTAKLIGKFQEQYSMQFHLRVTGQVDAPTADALNSFLTESGAVGPEPGGATFEVNGKVTSRMRAGVGQLRIEIVDKNVREDVHVGETVTDDGGSYNAKFAITGLQQRCKQRPDLQARAFTGGTFLGASEVRYDAADRETLNILLTEEASSNLASEHETLIGALTAHCGGSLRDLQETDERQDITYLANKTGWDARAVALAALADQFSARTADASGAPAIPQPFFYALFRAGLPANEDTLYHTDAGTLEGVWNKAADEGVIPKASADQISNLVGRFRALSAQNLLTSPALVGASSLKEMLVTSGLNEQQQATFAQLYAANRSDMPAFWKGINDAFGPSVANRLQVDGKLGLLTINNAGLMQKLHSTVGANGLSDPLQLAQAGYHRAEAWGRLLTDDVPIPKEIPGDTPETKRANYAGYLAAQVRLSYPTAAVAQMVKSGELPLTGAPNGVSEQVHAFLTEHQGKFEIGVQSVQQYLTQNKVQVADPVVRQLKRLQRVYQITPSDQSLTGLMRREVDGAYHVVRYDKDTFVQSFAADLGGAEAAALTYDKSAQIHNAVLNVAVSYLYARTAPAIGVHSPTNVLDPAPTNAGDVIAYATLESLLGSMDFCACDHCRSILSPAAYLVDLLQFLGSDDKVWSDFVGAWKSPQGGHEGAPYPFLNQAQFTEAGSPPNTEISPFEVLMSRRPDIQHLPLTCENTNTALPYLDVVNEMLEYFIANNSQKLSLKGYHGHDTNGSASEDLLASPQFVMDSAYMTLRGERFPSPLPFHQPLENLRRYLNKFEVPLPLAMERLRKTDDFERGANPYGWRDILMEELSLSRAEYENLTDSNVVPLWRMYGFASGTADADVIAGVSNAKQFARRVGITYEDLVDVLKTRFINPNSVLIPKLERLGVPFVTLKALKDGTITEPDFDTMLAALTVPPDPAEYGGDIKAWVKDSANYARIMGLVTLAIPVNSWTPSKSPAVGDCVVPIARQAGSTLYYECTTAGTSAASEPKWPTTPGTNTDPDGTVVWTCRDASSCLSFDNLAFRYSDPAKISQNILTVEFIRLLRFIRLWKKLGWTMDETDAAICALYRADLGSLDASDVNDVTKLDAGFLTLLPRLGIASRVMKALNLTVKRDLLPLLACWSDISTRGDTALYRQMFLNPALLEQDAVFADSGSGEFLSDSTKKLAAHAEALRSAFNLTADEYDRIVATLGYDASTTLTVPNVSAIYRRGWLARKLRLSVREFLALMQFTSLDPFTAPDFMHPAILRLIELVESMRNRSLKSAGALYLIWNQDLSGKSAPVPGQLAELGRTLRGDFVSIDDQFAAIEDPNGDPARSRMSLVYGQATSDAFFALLDDTLVVDVAYTHSAPTLEAAITTVDSRIAYDDFRHRLSHQGRVTTSMQTALKTIGGVSGEFQKAVDALFAQSEVINGLFFTRYPELKAAYDIAMAQPAGERHNIFLKEFQPDLSRKRKRQQALQRLSVAAAVDLAFTQTLLDLEDGSSPLHAATNKDKPALDDVMALETPGLAAQFFFRDTATGSVDLNVPAVANLDYVRGGSNPLPNAGNVVSGIWTGQIETPETGFYNFIIDADSAATVTLTLDGHVQALTQNSSIRRNTDPIELSAGILCEIALKIENVKDALSLKWETPKRAREVIPSRYLYPSAILDPFSNAYVRFLKATSLATGLGLTANELVYFATYADYRINGDGFLNVLSVKDDPVPTTAAALLKPFEALLDFARIKAEISPNDESLLTALKDPTAATQNADSVLFDITRWNPTSLNDVLAHVNGNIAGLGGFDLFQRVYDAIALMQKMGVSAKALIEATTNDPTGDTVRDLQAALRARYEATDWREVVRPINDEMRSLQRDALVAYILHQMSSHPESAHINTPDKLFEYFLTDVQMDPCMQTSRIRHALSSVQLFIERCLMNLEPRVSSAAINTNQWAWMKRYRVWEANRKVYLFPENWLEPELRDDKSPFFKEVESELLQSDITEERAATALLNYLSKLEEIAKLEPCSIHYVPRDDSKRTGEIGHIIARTAGAHRKYYYRRYEYGYWTPWEQIKLDIEDNPVISVVWNDRLLLFWLRILKETPLKGPDTTVMGPFSGGREKTLAEVSLTEIKSNASTSVSVSPPLVKVHAILCWSEYHNGKWQATKTSDINRPADLGEYPATGFDRSRLWLAVGEDNNLLRIEIQDGFNLGGKSWFHLYNTHSSPVSKETDPSIQTLPFFSFRWFSYAPFKTHYWNPFTNQELPRDVLSRSMATTQVMGPRHILANSWDAPFFYEDSSNVFYVTTTAYPVWIADYSKYGVLPALGFTKAMVIPPMVVSVDPKVQVKPRVWGDGQPIGPDPRIIDSVPIERFVTEDAYIHQAIATTGVVRFGDKQIGPSGAVANVATKV